VAVQGFEPGHCGYEFELQTIGKMGIIKEYSFSIKNL
jgi:hypothetical protein